ncbi:MAG TPA: Imm1 family immunity protein [Pseudonocardiaceae bacterium]|jgi:hypothetical protein|nr:Imm1 family immunity protein [Pseudonocardiaceae bacterium]
MSLSAEYWYRTDEAVRAASNSRSLATDADVEEIVELVRIGWMTDAAIFSDEGNQLIFGSAGNGRAAACFSGADGTYFTQGDGPDGASSYFQTDFPPNCQVAAGLLRDVLAEFLHTRRRSDKVAWQTVDTPELTDDERQEFGSVFSSWPE